MSAPFRDLFVELPRAVFEAMQAIGEGAIGQAQRKAWDPAIAYGSFRSQCRTPIWDSEVVQRGLARRYGVQSMELRLDQSRRLVVMLARLACGHFAESEIDEKSFHLAPVPLEAIDKAFDRIERRCYCMTQEPAQR